jgi:hypothetical protein
MTTIQQIPDESGLGNAINSIQQLNAKVDGITLAPMVDQYLSFLTTAQLPYVETRLQSGNFTNYLTDCNIDGSVNMVVTCYYESVNLSTYQQNQFLFLKLLNNFLETYTLVDNFKSSQDKVLSWSPKVEIVNPINIRDLEILDKPRGSKDLFWTFELTFQVNLTIMDCTDGDC